MFVRSRHPQRGAALAVALVMLLAITLLGVAALGGNRLQTRMAYGASESTLAFQSAESALIAGEVWLSNEIAQPIAECDTDCGEELTIRNRIGPAAITAANLRSDAWWVANGRPYDWNFANGAAPAAVTGQALGTISNQPRYAIQQIGKDPTGSLVQGQGRTYEIWYYEVNARGGGAAAAIDDSTSPPTVTPVTQTTVQSVFSKGY